MKCFECDGEYKKVSIVYELDTHCGKLVVPDVVVEVCDKCEDEIIGDESCVKIDEAWEKLARSTRSVALSTTCS